MSYCDFPAQPLRTIGRTKAMASRRRTRGVCRSVHPSGTRHQGNVPKKYRKTKEYRNKVSKAWYAANREKRLEAMRKTRSTDEFRRKNVLISSRRRARKRGGDDGTVT